MQNAENNNKTKYSVESRNFEMWGQSPPPHVRKMWELGP